MCCVMSCCVRVAHTSWTQGMRSTTPHHNFLYALSTSHILRRVQLSFFNFIQILQVTSDCYGADVQQKEEREEELGLQQ